MKTIKLYAWTLLLVLTTLSISSCHEKNNDPIEEPIEQVEAHFDLWVSIGGTSGMGSTNTQLVKSTKSMEEGTIDFKDNGADVTSDLHQESIIKGKYYYQINKKARFGKYQIIGDKVNVIKEFPFTTLKERRHTHAWIDSKTLILIGADGPAEKILWVKVDTEKMEIVSEGALDLPAPEEGEVFNTSGIARYREDGKIIYSFLYNKSKKEHFYVAFVNASNMKVEKVVKEDRAEMMAGTAYGELLQQKSFFDKNGDYYLACNTRSDKKAKSRTMQYGALLRIKKGATDFDKSYNGYNYPEGKIVTIDDLNNGKALLYIQDPKHTGAPGWGKNFNCYYAILDLTSGQLDEVKGLPYSSGTFSQRSIVIGKTAYIGVNPENEPPAVYLYDIPTGTIKKGLTITKGYSFDRIVSLQD